MGDIVSQIQAEALHEQSAQVKCHALAKNLRHFRMHEHPAQITLILVNSALKTSSTADPTSLAVGKSVSKFAEDLGLERGVTGYAYYSVPVALYAWLRHPDDFRSALAAALNCGGDTDTVGAIFD